MLSNIFYTISRAILWLIFKILFRIEVTGRENIPQSGGFILVSNHASFLDPIALGIACPRKLDYMGRHDLFDNLFFSKVLSLCRVFPVRRNSADLSALKEALSRLNRGSGLMVFPEGTRNLNNNFLKPQPGVGFLVTRTEVPIIPSFVRGTDVALPRGAKYIRPKKIGVHFGQQISIERRKPRNYQAIADEIMRCIKHLQCK